MGGYVIHRPDPAAMERVLEANRENAAGTIVRLAWQAGLLREEIHRLTWDQVDFFSRELRLPDRTVPLSGELADALAALRQQRTGAPATVVLSDRDQRPLNPQSISRLARGALDAAGETEVRLIDLRHDYIIRQLQEHDWQYVSRITGVEGVTLNLHFAAWIPAGKVSTRVTAERPPAVDELRLWKLLQDEGTSAAGAALQLTWQAGLTLEETAALTWDRVDWASRTLDLAGRQVPLNDALAQFLRQLRAAEGDPDGGPVVRSPRSRAAMRPDRLSRVTRTALVKAGLDDLTLRDLRQDHDLRAGGEARILQYAREHGCVTRNALMDLFGVSRTTAYQRLAALVERGRLVRVGTRYYLPAAVVPPEQQYQVIRAYLQAEGPAYRQDIARVLRLEPRQCSVILRHLVEEGKLTRENYRYALREA